MQSFPVKLPSAVINERLDATLPGLPQLHAKFYSWSNHILDDIGDEFIIHLSGNGMHFAAFAAMIFFILSAVNLELETAPVPPVPGPTQAKSKTMKRALAAQVVIGLQRIGTCRVVFHLVNDHATPGGKRP